MDRRELGNKGEKIASDHLKKTGYEILDTNFRTRDGEVDIIAKKDEEIIFIEVKTRRNDNFGYPEESVHAKKVEKMIKVANVWLEKNDKFDNFWRIDIIAIELTTKTPKITHIKNITQELNEG